MKIKIDMTTINIKSISTDDVVKVLRSDWLKINLFQRKIDNWDRLDKLLIESKGIGKVLHSWTDFCRKHPEFRKSIKLMGELNNFNTVMEFTCLFEGKLEKRAVLFGSENWEEINS